MKNTDIIDIRTDFFALSDVGLVRPQNEDNCRDAYTPNGYLFVMCDGMGGHVGGAVASKIAVDSIMEYMNSRRFESSAGALFNALDYANSQILAYVSDHPELKGMGTTACIVLIQDDKVWYAHIGDSRIYYFCSTQKRLYRLTKDHSVVQNLVDEGIITEAEAEHHPNKNKILKTLGVKSIIEPDVCNIPINPTNGDVLLLCTDGLSGLVSENLMLHTLRQGMPVEESVRLLVDLAKQAGGTDNISVQMIRVSHSPYKRPVYDRLENVKVRKPWLKWSIPMIVFACLVGVIVVLTNILSKDNQIEPVSLPPVLEKKVYEYEKQVKYRNFKLIKETEEYIIYGETSTPSKVFRGMMVDKEDYSYGIGDYIINALGEYKPYVGGKIDSYNADGTNK